jgi:hypothetical protein
VGGTENSLSGLFGMPLPSGPFWRSEYRFSSFNSANLPVFFSGRTPIGISENMKPYRVGLEVRLARTVGDALNSTTHLRHQNPAQECRVFVCFFRSTES